MHEEGPWPESLEKGHPENIQVPETPLSEAFL